MAKKRTNSNSLISIWLLIIGIGLTYLLISFYFRLTSIEELSDISIWSFAWRTKVLVILTVLSFIGTYTMFKVKRVAWSIGMVIFVFVVSVLLYFSYQVLMVSHPSPLGPDVNETTPVWETPMLAGIIILSAISAGTLLRRSLRQKYRVTLTDYLLVILAVVTFWLETILPY